MSVLYNQGKAEFIYKNFYKFGKKHKGNYEEFPNGPSEYFGGYTKDILKLNWLSLEDIEDNCDLLDNSQRVFLSALLNPQLHREYMTPQEMTEGILSTVAGLKNYSKTCMCSTVPRANPKLAKKCDCRKYCNRCAELKRRSHRIMYLKSWEQLMKKNVYFITLSEAGTIRYGGNTAPITIRWDRLRDYATSMKKTGLIEGGLLTEELSVQNLKPNIQVNPHIHILCVSSHKFESHEVDGVKVHVKPIIGKQHWHNALNYLTKATAYAEVYLQEWTPTDAEVVNRNFREISNAFRVMLTKRAQSLAFGTFHANHPKNIIANKVKYAAKKPCKVPNKKIECTKIMYRDFEQGVQDTIGTPLPESTRAVLKYAYNSGLIAPKKPSMLKKILGYGGLLAGGAYLYGKHNNTNALSGFSNLVDDKVVNPVMNYAEPYAAKLFPDSYGKFADKAYGDYVRGNVEDQAFYNTAKPLVDTPSKLQGTPLDGLTRDKFQEATKGFSEHPAVGTAIGAGAVHGLGSLANSVAQKLPFGIGSRIAGGEASLLSKIPGAGKLLGGAGRVMPWVMNAGLVADGVNPSTEVADAIAEKYHMGDFARNMTRGAAIDTHAAGTLGGGALAAAGTAAVMAGAGFSPTGPAALIPAAAAGAGSLVGSMVMPKINEWRHSINNADFGTALSNNRINAARDMLQEGLKRKQQYGNDLLLKSVYKYLSPEQLASVAKNTADAELRQQILANAAQ